MNWKKKLLKKNNLYIILDTEILPKGRIYKLAELCAKEELDFVQLRAKCMNGKELIEIGKRLRAIFKDTSTLFIVNDRLDVASILGCGLHVGASDIPLEEIFSILGKGALVGFTVHSRHELEYANKFPLSYVSFGPLFRTSLKFHLKPQGIKKFLEMRERSKHKMFAIGGINIDNIDSLIEEGIGDIVILSAFCNAKNPQQFLRIIKEKMNYAIHN